MYDWELSDPVFNAWLRMRQAWEAMDKALEVELGKHQATLSQIDVLMILSSSRRPLSPGEIASFMFREKHSASALLTRMQRAGYVRKTRSKKDQRVVKIKMQPKGADLLKQAMPSAFGQAHKMLETSLSGEELKHLDGLMKKVRDGALRELGLKAEPLPATIDAEGLLAERS
jgi:DNA-binding MarR family transcriptional regulator